MKFRETKKPQDHYLAKIAYLSNNPSRHGMPMVTFAFRIVGDDYSVYPWYCPITDDSMHKVTAVFHALDLPTPQKDKILSGEIPIFPNAFMYQEVIIQLESNLWKGNWRSSVKRVLPKNAGKPIGLVYDVPDEEPKL